MYRQRVGPQNQYFCLYKIILPQESVLFGLCHCYHHAALVHCETARPFSCPCTPGGHRIKCPNHLITGIPG